MMKIIFVHNLLIIITTIVFWNVCCVVLMVNLVDGLAKGRVERWKPAHDEQLDARPLTALR